MSTGGERLHSSFFKVARLYEDEAHEHLAARVKSKLLPFLPEDAPAINLAITACLASLEFRHSQAKVASTSPGFKDAAVVTPMKNAVDFLLAELIAALGISAAEFIYNDVSQNDLKAILTGQDSLTKAKDVLHHLILSHPQKIPVVFVFAIGFYILCCAKCVNVMLYIRGLYENVNPDKSWVEYASDKMSNIFKDLVGLRAFIVDRAQPHRFATIYPAIGSAWIICWENDDCDAKINVFTTMLTVMWNFAAPEFCLGYGVLLSSGFTG